MADAAPQPNQADQFADHLAKLDAANASLYDKMRKTTDDFISRTQAATANLSFLGKFQPFSDFMLQGRLLTAFNTNSADRDIFNAYLDAVASANGNADTIRARVKSAINPPVVPATNPTK